jgi:23S rRNA (guanosine2251-2'-O)-methyltransferase
MEAIMKKTGGRRADKRTEAPRGEKPVAKPHGRSDSRVKTAEGPRSFRRPSPELAVLYGYHAVREALRAGKRNCLDLFATAPAAERLAGEIAASGVALHIVEPETLFSRLGQDSVHQGVFLEARPLPTLDITEITVQSGVVLALDQITDPHNVGAIFRTASAFAVDAIIVTDRHAPEFSAVLAKAASGGLEHVPVVEVVNLARALDKLGEAGFLRVGLDSEGTESLEKTRLSRPTVLVLGAEGKGLRRLTRERCDVLARLDMPGAIKSLNVSNACAVALTLVHAALPKVTP